jgi:hypothetical protein
LTDQRLFDVQIHVCAAASVPDAYFAHDAPSIHE